MNYNYISSKQNNLVKKTGSLYKKKYRDKEDLFVIEGLRSVNLVYENKLEDIEYVLVTEEYVEKCNYNLDIDKFFVCSEDVFKSMTDAVNAQGILAVCKKPKRNVEDLLNKENVFILVCENLQDPGNAGTLIRTADSVGADGIVFTQGSVDIYNPKVVRSTVGSILNVNIYENIEIEKFIKDLNKSNITCYGTSLDTTEFHDEVKYNENLAVFLGNEANGLLQSTQDMLDIKVKIPMCGKAESLNVGVAGSVVCYEILRQKRKGGI